MTEKEHVFKTANDVLNHTFLFDMEHDMERTHEPVHFDNEVQWEFNPGIDPEFTWQFNRHRFLICLAQAYVMSREEKYAHKAIELMLHFINDQPVKKGNRMGSWRILEIGIRAANWMKSLEILKDSQALTSRAKQTITASLKQHASLIMDEHTPYCYAGNWGVLENHGLFLTGIYLFEHEESAAYIAHAKDVLRIGLGLQVMEDGMQLEQSPMYHNEVLRLMLEVILYGRRRGISFSKEFTDKVYALSMASLTMLTPGRHLIPMSDSDVMNMRPVMNLAACVFSDPVFKSMGSRELDFDNQWLLTEEEKSVFKALIPIEPDFTSANLYDSGQYLFRSSWKEDADLLHFDGGLLGTSHGHSDTLHVNLYLEGKDFLVDSGRFTYVFNKDRQYLRSPQAHNTVVVDDKEFNEWSGGWFSQTVSAQSRQKMKMIGVYEYAQAGHSGYTTLDNPVWVNRKVIHIKPGIYIIADECYTSGTHTYHQYFHFDAAVTLDRKDEKYAASHDGTKALFFFDPATTQSVLDTEMSKHYNEKLPNKTIRTEKKGTGFQGMTTVCIKGGPEAEVSRRPVRSHATKEVFPASQATGLKIATGSKTYYVIIAHAEMPAPVDLYMIEDRFGCGNVIVFDIDDNDPTGTALNW